MSQTTVPFILDTTEVGIGCHLLTLTLGYQRRALPVAWQVGEGSRGHTSGDEQVALLQYGQTLLPNQADVIVLGDGEFGLVQLLHWLDAQGWSYCLRVASDTYILYENEWRRLLVVGASSVRSIALNGLTPKVCCDKVMVFTS